jgi:hypothetical protein
MLLLRLIRASSLSAVAHPAVLSRSDLPAENSPIPPQAEAGHRAVAGTRERGRDRGRDRRRGRRELPGRSQPPGLRTNIVKPPTSPLAPTSRAKTPPPPNKATTQDRDREPRCRAGRGSGRCRCRGCPAAATTPRRRPARQPAQRTAPARSQNTAPEAEHRPRRPRPHTVAAQTQNPAATESPTPPTTPRPGPAAGSQVPGARIHHSAEPKDFLGSLGLSRSSFARASRLHDVGAQARRPTRAPAPRTPRATGSIPTARPPHQHREAPDGKKISTSFQARARLRCAGRPTDSRRSYRCAGEWRRSTRGASACIRGRIGCDPKACHASRWENEYDVQFRLNGGGYQKRACRFGQWDRQWCNQTRHSSKLLFT